MQLMFTFLSPLFVFLPLLSLPLFVPFLTPLLFVLISTYNDGSHYLLVHA